jgi:hypothetical protein
MLSDASELMPLLRAIARGDAALALQLLEAEPSLATARLARGASRGEAKEFYLEDIPHYVYAGDCALHVAAAGHQPEVARALVRAGAQVSVHNRRGAHPLHYAADGVPGASNWKPDAQAATIAFLIEAGGDPNAGDAGGVAPLHRAVRTRCAAAVGALLEGGADPHLPNKSGSTAMALAVRTTGRGGSGSSAAKAEQEEIIRLLLLHGATS